ncbi:carbamoyl-phosphate synthase L chain, N-terminal domain-containing protein [Mycena leptocephala]|nr:carbamoyl-phosphate synthase L chain, N-terminal domain-containing protein [Mycena leptocephala]
MNKLLVGNRGEMALRIIRTAKVEGILTVAIYTSSDTLFPHVALADEALFLAPRSATETESTAYLSAARILALCHATLPHGGYGFLSVKAAFSQAVFDAGIPWLGPTRSVIKTIRLKHLAREVAMELDVICVPGSMGLVSDEMVALEVAARIGCPVILKANAKCGKMWMVFVRTRVRLEMRLRGVTKRAEVRVSGRSEVHLGYDLMPRFFGVGREIVCMGERECSSIPSRHQNIIEETASPFLAGGPELRARMYAPNPKIISQSEVITVIVDVQKYIPGSMDDMTFPGRRYTFPIVLDDQWSCEALTRNVDYLERDNGFDTAEVLAKLVASD